jgi:hypothetical protein
MVLVPQYLVDRYHECSSDAASSSLSTRSLESLCLPIQLVAVKVDPRDRRVIEASFVTQALSVFAVK